MKIFSIISLLSILLLFGCGQENNSGTLRTTSDQINTNGGYNGGYNGGANNNGQICGTIYSQFDGFNINFIFITNQGQYTLVAGDQQTQDILRQMPPNVYAYGVCGTQQGQISNNVIRLIGLNQP